MAEDVTYTLVADLKTGSELGRADLSNTNAPTTEVNILQKLPSTLSINQSMEIALHVFEDLALDDKMDYSSVTGATLTGRLINSTDIAITLDASLTISGTGDYIVTAIIAKDVIPVAWTAGVVRLKWELSTASNKSIIFQDQSFVDPAGTQNGTAVTGFKVKDSAVTVQPTAQITFSTKGSVLSPGSSVATVRNDVTTNVSYEYDNTVAKADPGAGLMRFNHATIASATEIYLDDLGKDGIDNGTFFSNMGTTSTLRFGAVDDPTAGELFTVTSAADETGYWTLVVVHVDSGTVGMLDTKTYGLGYTKAPSSTTPSEVLMQSMTGHGSTATKIVYFGTTAKDTGTDLTLVTDSTNGSVVTVNTAGAYAVMGLRDWSSGSNWQGLSVNGTVTTNITDLSVGNVLIAEYSSSVSNGPRAYSLVAIFAVDDVIRMHDTGGARGSNFARSKFRVVGPL